MAETLKTTTDSPQKIEQACHWPSEQREVWQSVVGRHCRMGVGAPVHEGCNQLMGGVEPTPACAAIKLVHMQAVASAQPKTCGQSALATVVR